MFLGFELHAWEHWMLASLVVVAIGGVGVAMSTYAVIKLQRVEVAQSKRELEEYKADAARQIAKADANAALANEGAAKANESAAALEKEAAQAKERLESETRARLEFEQKVAARRLTKAQIDEIGDKLRGKVTKVTLERVLDAEPYNFGADLIEALRGGGIEVDIVDFGLQRPPPTGLSVIDAAAQNSIVAQVISYVTGPPPLRQRVGVNVMRNGQVPEHPIIVVGYKAPASN